MHYTIFIGGCLFSVFVSAASGQAAVEYTVTDLGTLGGSFSHAYDINVSGQVSGFAAGDGFHAFLWTPTTPNGISGTMQNVGTPGVANSGAVGINASGQVAGYSYATGNGHAFLWTPAMPNGTSGTMRDLGTLGGTQSYGHFINDNGQVAGDFWAGDITTRHAFMYDGTMHDLGTLGGTVSGAYGINNNGQVTGYAAVASGYGHAFVWIPTTPGGANGTMHDIGTLGGNESFGYGINASGQVSGFSNTTGSYPEHAFLWTPTTPGGSSGTMQDLGSLAGPTFESQGFGINAHGDVVGTSREPFFNFHAFLYTTGGGLVDLNSLIDPLSGWVLTEARAINDAGQIVGWGRTSDRPFDERAFLLTPLAEPTISGDYNGDEVVDAADYIVWRKTNGSAAAYTTWRANFGCGWTAAGGSTADSSVPEPATLAIIALGLFIGLSRYRARI